MNYNGNTELKTKDPEIKIKISCEKKREAIICEHFKSTGIIKINAKKLKLDITISLGLTHEPVGTLNPQFFKNKR